jgi:hypothetical protein
VKKGGKELVKVGVYVKKYVQCKEIIIIRKYILYYKINRKYLLSFTKFFEKILNILTIYNVWNRF